MVTDVERMVRENEGLVFFTINKYFQQYLHDEDIQQIGRIALWKACQKWTPEKGAFATYAAAAIKHTIEREWTRQNAKKRSADVQSLDAPIYHDAMKDDTFVLRYVLSAVDDIDYLDLDSILEVLDSERMWVLQMMLYGYNMAELADIKGCSHQRIHQLRNDIAKVIRGEMSERQRSQAIRRRAKEKEAAGQGRTQQGDAGPQSQLVIRLLNSGAAEKIKRPGDNVQDEPRRPRGRPRKMA